MLDAIPRSLTDHQRAVLTAVAEQPGIRRSELAERMEISPQTAMRAILPLIEQGLVDEDQVASGGRGKPASQLTLVPGRLMTLGVSLALDRVRVLYRDLDGRAIASAGVSRTFTDARTQLDTLNAELDRAARDLPGDAILTGVGVTVQGFFLDRGRRFASRADPVGWAAIDLHETLTRRFGVPVTILNDGRVLASSLIGTSRHRHFICLHLGSGIGGGAVTDGQLITGAFGNAGELGQLFPKAPGRPTEPNFLDAAGVTGWQDWPGLDGLSDSRRDRLDAWIAQAGRTIGDAIGVALALLDFEAVYVCSRMPEDLLVRLCDHIDVPPLGSDFVVSGMADRPVNPPPVIYPHHVPNYVQLANDLALKVFASPADPDPVSLTTPL